MCLCMYVLVFRFELSVLLCVAAFVLIILTSHVKYYLFLCTGTSSYVVPSSSSFSVPPTGSVSPASSFSLLPPSHFSNLWKPRTAAGRIVKRGKVKSLKDLRRLKFDIKEPEMVDVLYPGLKEEVLKVTVEDSRTYLDCRN